MSNKIDSMTNQYLQITGRPAKTSAPDGAPSQATGRRNETATRRDSVEVTDSARTLQALESRLAGLSEVDQSRVDQVRSRIESGDYVVSSQRTADKMIALDRLLPDEK